jgi:hypothetical protein
MAHHLNQGLLKRLAVLSTAVGLGATPSATEVGLVPEEAIHELLDDDVLDGMEDRDRQALLRVITLHPAEHVRLLATERLGSRIAGLNPQILGALAQLVADPSESVRNAARQCFHELLAKQSGIDRLGVVCEWTLSADPARRLAVAHALRRGLQTPVSDTALQALGNDPDRDVREAARAAGRG